MKLRSLRTLWIALFISVGLNLFVAGMLVAGHFFGPPPNERVRRGAPFHFRAAIEALPAAKREEIKTLVRSRLDEVRRMGREARESRRAVRRVLRAEPYDQNAVNAAYREMRRRHGLAMENLHRTMSEVLGKLTPEERRAFMRAGYRRLRRERHERRERE